MDNLHLQVVGRASAAPGLLLGASSAAVPFLLSPQLLLRPLYRREPRPNRMERAARASFKLLSRCFFYGLAVGDVLISSRR
jgi:hypothetical protein